MKLHYYCISSNSVKEHIISTAGKSFEVNVTSLLDSIILTKNGAPKPLTELERIMMKASTDKEIPNSHTVNAVIYQEVDKEAANVEMPKYEQPEEVVEFAKKLTSSAGISEFVFGRDTVEKGRNLVTFMIRNAGYKNIQTAVSDSLK